MRRALVLAALLGTAIAVSRCGSSTATSVTAASGPTRCQVSVAGSPASFSPAGGSGTVSVSTTRDCTWSASAGTSWISLAGTTSGQGNGAVPFSVAANTVVSARTGAIAVNGQDFTVSQQAADCTFAVSPSTVSLASTGGSTSVSVQSQAGCAWTAAASAPWLAITSGASGSGNGSVAFTATANNGAARSTTVAIAGQSVAVSQAAADAPPPPVPPPPAPPPGNCTYSISPSSLDFGAVGGTGSVSVSTSKKSCAWSATAGASWVSIIDGSQGTGNGSVTFAVDPNAGDARSTTLTIAGQSFTVNEAAALAPPAVCTYFVSPTTVSIGAAGGPGLIAVTTAAGCAWFAASNVSWITITGGATGVGSGTVKLSIARNNNAARTGTLTVAGQTVTVSQSAGQNGGGDNNHAG